MKFFTYILKSEKDGRYFYGQTNNLQRRLNQHNRGLEKATRGSRPWILLAYKEFDTRGGAMSLANRLKKLETASEIESFIRSQNFHLNV